jgi:hypothetical protein
MQKIYNNGVDATIGARLFTAFDGNKSGTLERKEALTFFLFAHQLLLNKGKTLPKDKVAWSIQCLNYYDKSCNGCLSVTEFNEALKLISGTSTDKEIEQINFIAANNTFNGNLQTCMTNYLNDLQTFNSNPAWKDPAYVENAVCRYHQWLIIRQKANQSIPLPQDIKFILIVHMLHPYDYQKVNTSLFGGIKNMDHLITFTPTPEQITWLEDTWKIEWNGENINDTTTKKLEDYQQHINPPIGAPLIQSALGQIQFINKILALAQNDFNFLQSPQFINRAVVDYRKFLNLRKYTPQGIFLVPSVFIDLAWHSHMLTPIQYTTDCMYLAGMVLDHDDSISENVLGDHWKQTNILWRKIYGEILVSHNAQAYANSMSSYGRGKRKGSGDKVHKKMKIKKYKSKEGPEGEVAVSYSSESISGSFSDDASEREKDKEKKKKQKSTRLFYIRYAYGDLSCGCLWRCWRRWRGMWRCCLWRCCLWYWRLCWSRMWGRQWRWRLRWWW